ncbi:hypothetical protein TOPH_05473 [Tolypocladium ophioglossoides CBS 100239]|uniref:Uncharacterized protein n=1 Tax=Tolypocladium ophioglossoides (strain CBS 100239) TaxID=1163406 RepID=A0A0L0N775_TOLOC|nr:hypothetical protein TOPH_05473 [Tolypocladium ophioglossoides CBS 100239]
MSRLLKSMALTQHGPATRVLGSVHSRPSSPAPVGRRLCLGVLPSHPLVSAPSTLFVNLAPIPKTINVNGPHILLMATDY